MITDKMAQALNDQIREELYSAYIYLSMSSYAACAGMGGVAHWFQIQTKEELTHVDKFYNYLNSQGCRGPFRATWPMPGPNWMKQNHFGRKTI